MTEHNGTPERWTMEMLDRLAATVATEMAISRERMARIEEHHVRAEERMNQFSESLENFAQKIERDHDQANAERQALSRDMAQMVATRQADIARVQQIEAALVKITDLTEGIAMLLAKSDDHHPTVLAKLNRIDNKIDRILENQS